MDMTHDRTTPKSTHPDVPDSGLSDDLRSFLTDSAPTKPVRQRNLRATFRPVPDLTLDPGFPGTKAFAAHRPDRRSAGAALAPARAGEHQAPAAPARADNPAGRRAAVLEAGRGAAADRAAQPAAASPGRGRVRGRGGSPKKKQAQADGAEGLNIPIADSIPIGVRVTVTDPSHPWHTYAGAVISDPEKYGLGWFGQRLLLDGNNGEAFIRPEQTDWTKKAIRRAVALPREIGKLVPKEETKTPPKIIPSETERADARRLFREIGERFNQNRKKSKTAAYAAYRHDLMANLDTLIMGGALDLKEATTIITNLEQYTRETEAESTETPATILGRWLRMDASELAELETKVVEETVEDEENLEEEDSGEEEIDEPDSLPDPSHAADSH
jgi:hypothetical protein